MLFNSYEFIFFFLPITFIIYFSLTHYGFIKISKVFLAISSLFFYAWWNYNYLILILLSIFFNYTAGNILNKNTINGREGGKFSKFTLIVSISINVALLGYFKYSDFFISNINYLLDLNISLLHIMLPLAISFFTFQQIAYLVDSYKGKTKNYSFIDYCVFVCFFPQLIAGPIVHHSHMMPQFSDIKNLKINYKNIAKGILIFSIGLFKKVIIADRFGVWAASGFDIYSNLNLFQAWFTSLSYTFQIYFDFSGYCDMAIGLALLFNIKLPINFNSPYKALNIQDFWRRWHITLGAFLKDYIYIPLGGNKNGKIRMYVSLFVTFLIGGIWHGAGWTFVIWGVLHGMALIIHRVFLEFKVKINPTISWFITFNFINITWVFFRANNAQDAFKVLKGMFGLDYIALPEKSEKYLEFLLDFGIKFERVIPDFNGNSAFLWFLTGFCIILFCKNSIWIKDNINFNKKLVFLVIVIFVYSVLKLSKASEFLYFNF